MPPERDHPPPPSALDWPARAGTSEWMLRELSARGHVRRRRRTIGSAVLAAVAVMIGTVFWLRSGRSPATTASSARTAILAPTQQQILPDGSVVELKGDAQLAVDFSGALRRVELTHGTAHFQVAKNPNRPFVVSAGGVTVRAVGTAFSVELDRGTVEVLVTEGRVALESVSPAPPAAITTATPPAKELATLGAGSGVVLDLAATATGSTPAMRAIPAAALEEKLAWRARQLELSGTPLVEVVAMLNRHAGNRPHFTIADPEIESVKLSGVIRTDKTEALIHLLEAECGVHAERGSDGLITLRKTR
jgi:transmembrane sensor